jgi:hypothetical protein
MPTLSSQSPTLGSHTATLSSQTSDTALPTTQPSAASDLTRDSVTASAEQQLVVNAAEEHLAPAKELRGILSHRGSETGDFQHGDWLTSEERTSSGSIVLGKIMAAIKHAPQTVVGMVSGQATSTHPASTAGQQQPFQPLQKQASGAIEKQHSPPGPIAMGERTCAEWHESVTLLFCDIVG